MCYFDWYALSHCLSSPSLLGADTTCHVNENAQSAGQGDILEQKTITRTKSDKKMLEYRGKPKVTYITGGKGLLTIFSISLLLK